MFEANHLIHFVFANDKDLYYCRNSLRMNIEQRLWWELQQAGYKNIYYLRSFQRDFEISTFGEPGADLPTSWILHTPTTTPGEKAFRLKLRSWMQGGAAAVCSLEQFCKVMDQRERYEKTWEELLALQRSHSGVLIMTVNPEEIPLLQAGAFLRYYGERTGELPFITADPHEMRTNPSLWPQDDHCVLWNVYAEKELQAFLAHVILQDPEKISDRKQIRDLASYLHLVLNQNSVIGDKLLGGRTILRYQDLFALLADRDNWRQLCQNCGKTSLQRFCETYCLPEQMKNAGVTAEGGERILADCKALMDGLVQEECNVRIRAHLCRLLLLLGQKENERDWGSCERVLYAIRFCLQWIHTAGGSEEEAAIMDILEQLTQYIKLSEDYFMEERNLAMIRVSHEHEIAAKVRQQLMTKHSVSEKFLTRFEDLFLSSMLKLSMKQGAMDLRRTAEDFEKWTREMEQSKTEHSLNKDSPPDDPQDSADSPGEKPSEKTEKEYIYTINASMYDIDIPSRLRQREET